jgi:surfeit locus 1 family protein
LTVFTMDEDPARSPRPPRALTALVGLAALVFLVLVALGVWQIQRLAWKEDLIERVQRHVNAAPVPGPAQAAWASLTRENHEYLRVELRGEYDFSREALVQATTELGAGHWVLTPLRGPDGFTLLVNRGFVPSGLPNSRWTMPAGEQRVVGLLRFTEPDGSILRANDVAHDRWYSRDVAAIAGSRRIAGPVAPYFIDVVADPASPQAWPRPGLTVLRFSNNHLVYALTWFALAAMVASAIVYLVMDERRLRRLAGDHRLAPAHH